MCRKAIERITKRFKAFFGYSIYANVRKCFVYTGLVTAIISMFASFTFIDDKKGSINIFGIPEVEFVRKIWDAAPHNAFTDLVFYKGYWYCTFREAEVHFSKDVNGIIRIIRSSDTESWITVATIADKDFDLRDPKLCITPQDKIMLSYTGTKLIDTLPDLSLNQYFESRVSFSADGEKWSKPQNMSIKNEVAWRITWYKGVAYTISWHRKAGINLYKSTNGINYKFVSKLALPGFPNEASITFMPDGKMVAIIRDEDKPNKTYFAEALPPYTKWSFTQTPKFACGPNLIKMPDNRLMATFRLYDNGNAKLWLGKIENNRLEEFTEIKSGGDCGYAGMHWKDGALWISYYSTHEKKTSIYLSKIKFHPVVQ